MSRIDEKIDIQLSPEQRAEIRLRQLQQLNSNTPIGVLSTLINSGILIFFLWDSGDNVELMAWFGVAVVVALFRIFFLYYCKATLSIPSKVPLLININIAGALAGGAIWGYVGSALFPADAPLLQAFIVIVLAGMSAGSIIAYSYVLPAAMSFLMPALLPVIITLFLQNEAIHYGIGGMILLFLLLLLSMSVRLNRIITKSLKLRFEKQTLNAQLMHSEKLASLGTLSAGVAHELKNPLTAVLGFSELVLADPGNESLVTKLTERTVSAVHRMTAIIDHLKSFTRDSKNEEFAPLSIKEVIDDALLLVESQLTNANIEVKLDVEKGASELLGDKGQLESIFQNLLVNSRDAFDSIEDDRKKEITFQVRARNSAIILMYSDNAAGMSEEVVKNLFTPFYTTKEVGKGTGLGMSIAHGILKRHGGEIAVESEAGVGTTFTITFNTT